MLAQLSSVNVQGYNQMCLQSCTNVASAAALSEAVVRLVALLRQPCSQAQGHCTVITRCPVLRHLRAKCVIASSYVSLTNALCVLQQH